LLSTNGSHLCRYAALELEPGPHTLTLQFANANHQSFGKKFAKTISINVE
jgi:hypothetical protein